jgi:hypothetical protein
LDGSARSALPTAAGSSGRRQSLTPPICSVAVLIGGSARSSRAPKTGPGTGYARSLPWPWKASAPDADWSAWTPVADRPHPGRAMSRHGLWPASATARQVPNGSRGRPLQVKPLVKRRVGRTGNGPRCALCCQSLLLSAESISTSRCGLHRRMVRSSRKPVETLVDVFDGAGPWAGSAWSGAGSALSPMFADGRGGCGRPG